MKIQALSNLIQTTPAYNVQTGKISNYNSLNSESNFKLTCPPDKKLLVSFTGAKEFLNDQMFETWMRIKWGMPFGTVREFKTWEEAEKEFGTFFKGNTEGIPGADYWAYYRGCEKRHFKHESIIENRTIAGHKFTFVGTTSRDIGDCKIEDFYFTEEQQKMLRDNGVDFPINLTQFRDNYNIICEALKLGQPE